MTEAERLVRRWMESGDHSLLAEDVRWRVSPGYPVPHRDWHGRAAVANGFFPTLRRRFPHWRIAVESFSPLADGRLLASGAYDARDAGGRSGQVPFLHVWTVRDGTIAGVEAVADFAAFAIAAPDGEQG
ncbi:nuclear transport factor 2 family protein [Roseomonas sp. KE2513]|uniref:nuclear transport factor 2 family protein n=1 Tax=Roseomonas sp. KE2513 TaxID=2479202 RepID=UPI0018DF011D|nr:nuclear transport factor 2 family protein [Roseomonas sp. KE2513]MBI0534590.1 nuclear transport factor 2 family protein [Roseomonas sp. KE2513]